MTGHPFGGVGLASTARDYLRFAQMLLNGGEIDGELMISDDLPPATQGWAPGVRYGTSMMSSRRSSIRHW